jgi:hypothetical protein
MPPLLRRRMRRGAMSLVAGLVAIATPIHAQAWTRDWPQAGDEVRVSSGVPPLARARMTFRRQVNDTLVFARASGLSREKVETAIALTSITRLEMHGMPDVSRHRRAAVIGKGIAIGAVGGGLIGYLSRGCGDQCGYFGPGFDRAVKTAAGVLAGALVGGITGGVVGRNASETWRDIHPLSGSPR